MADYKKNVLDLNVCACPHFSECKKDICYGQERGDRITYKFRFDRARVGDEYGKNPNIPRVVMVGIEGFSDTQEIQGIPPLSLTADNPHYNGVKYVLSYLLADFLGKRKPEPRITKSGVDWVKDALKSFCLCELFRCAFVPISALEKSKGLCHTEAMKKYCTKRLIDEIKALDAEIVVIQATGSNSFPEENFKLICEEFQCEKVCENEKRARLLKGENNGHSILIIQTYHGAYARFKSHRYLEELNHVLDEAIKLYRSPSATV